MDILLAIALVFFAIGFVFGQLYNHYFGREDDPEGVV